MKHLRWLPPGEWPQVPVDPEDPEAGERDATEQELLQMDLVPLGEHPDGGWIVDCLGREVDPEDETRLSHDLPGYRLAEGRARYRAAPADIAEVALQAAVWRETGSDLRAAACEACGREAAPPERSPKTRGAFTQMDHPLPDDDELVEAARDREGSRRERVPVREVQDSDVVERLHTHRWSGESPVLNRQGEVAS